MSLEKVNPVQVQAMTSSITGTTNSPLHRSSSSSLLVGARPSSSTDSDSNGGQGEETQPLIDRDAIERIPQVIHGVYKTETTICESSEALKVRA